MGISRTLWLLATIFALSHVEDVKGGAASTVVDVLDGKAEVNAIKDVLDGVEYVYKEADEITKEANNIFYNDLKEFGKKVVKTAKKVKTFYENHKALITAGEFLVLAGTGLGEAGMMEEMVAAYRAGGARALLEGAGELLSGGAESVTSMANGVFDTLAEVERVPSLTEIGDAGIEAGKKVIALLDPWMEKIATNIACTYPLAASQIVTGIANLVGTSDSKINTPAMACKMELLLKEYMKRTVNARFEQVKPQGEYADVVDFYTVKRRVQNKSYNKDGYIPDKKLRCKTSGNKCFTDNFRAKTKSICTGDWNCLEDYLSMIRHRAEAVFPIELFEKTCAKSKISLDQMDANSNGTWTITIKRILIDSRWWQVQLVIDVIVDGKLKHRYHTNIQREGTALEVNKFFNIGPVIKNKPNLEIKAWNERPLFKDEYKEKFTVSGNIYKLWKDGYTPQRNDAMIDVAFAWTNATKPNVNMKSTSG